MKFKNQYKARIVVIIFYYVFFGFLLKAQKGFIADKSLNSQQNYVIKYWNSENGLPQNSIISCIQTSDGYLWFSTQEGLLKFDGNSFKLFNAKNTPNLSASSFKYLFEDHQKNLWLISQQNKLVKYHKGTFNTINLKEPISSICESSVNDLVISGTSGNIYRLKDSTLILLTSLKNQYIHKLAYSGQNELYIFSEKGVFLYSNQQLSEITQFSKEKAIGIKTDENGLVWLLTQHGLYKLGGTKHQSLILPKELSDLKQFNDFCVVNEQHIFINTNLGLFILKGQDLEKVDLSSGLSSNNTTTIYKDRENNIWVGTANAGINKLKTKTIFTFDKNDGLTDDGCGPLLKLKDNSVLISNYCKGLSIYKNNTFKPYPTTKTGCIWAIGNDKAGHLWIGTYNQGLFKLKANISEHFYSKDKSFRNDYFAIFEDSRNNIWLGSDDGLYKYENNTILRVEKELVKGRVSYITEDRKNHLWICTNNGLVLITKDNAKIYTSADGLPGNKVRHVYEDKEGTLWITTYDGGIARFKNKKFFSYNASEKIIDNFTSCIVEDDDNYFWISSNKGIYRVSRKNLNEYADGKALFLDVTYFGREDGMKSSECNGGFQYAGVKLEDGRIMFPTVSGVVQIDPRSIQPNNFEQSPIIESILIDNKPVSLSDSVIILSNNTQKLEINYSVPFFGEANKLLFEHRLEGYDETWGKPTSERVALYYNLPPGDYIFKIAIYGYVNEKKIHFKVPYPFWQTAAFYILTALFVAVLIFSLAYLRTRRIRKNEALKTEINKQYAALELKALQSQMNPHFMFNCLNTIKYFISANEKSSANKYLDKFSKLIRLFLEHTNSNSIRLSEELQMLALYIEMEQLRLDNSFEYRLDIDPNLSVHNIEIPTMLLQPYVENAIHHGLRNRPNSGVLSITISKEKNNLIITIDDNGIGREKAEEIKRISAKEHSSMGMKITAERINTLNFIKNIHIETEIIDKKDHNGIPLGTLVVIKIPLNNEQHH